MASIAILTAPTTGFTFGKIISALGAIFLISFLTFLRSILDLNTPPTKTRGNFEVHQRKEYRNCGPEIQ